jgi:hypothetical protein
MGYTHHWYRPPVIDKEIFQGIRADFEKLILPLADVGVPLAGWRGTDAPQIEDEAIRFNGLRNCGHPPNEDIFVPYPSDHAHGIGPSSTAIGECDAYLRIDHRCCNGSCSHEAFVFPRMADRRETESDDEETRGLVFYWTKTAFKPYDIAVTAALIIAKRYLREKLVVESNGLTPQWQVESNGLTPQWQDAKELCQQHLGYGDWFGIVEDPRMELWPGPNGTKVEREVRVRLLVEMDPVTFLL